MKIYKIMPFNHHLFFENNFSTFNGPFYLPRCLAKKDYHLESFIDNKLV